MYMIRLKRECFDNPFPLVTHIADQFLKPRSQARGEDRPPVAGKRDEVIGQAVNSMGTATRFHVRDHTTRQLLYLAVRSGRR